VRVVSPPFNIHILCIYMFILILCFMPLDIKHFVCVC